MTDANEPYEAVVRELGNVVVSDTGDAEEERGSFASHGGAVSDDIPPSLLSYFATSKSRAAVCERFIVEELEDLEYMMNLPIEPKEDMMKLNTQFTRVTENENNSSSDTYLLPSPTETEVLLTHSVSMCLNTENEDETDEHMGCDKFLGFKVRTHESSITEEEKKKSSECQRELREKRHSEEMKREEKRRQREIDFQEELKKIMEAEKLHQKELELMEKRAQEKLEQELLLQQELISNLQKRVEEERKKREEEQERIKEEGERKRKEEEEKRKREEEDRRKREVEKIKRKMERKMAEEETRRKKEEEEQRKIEEMRLKEELRRKKEEQQQKKRKEDEKRKREEEQNKIEEDKRKEEEEKRKREEEDRRKREVEKIKREMERKRAEEEMRRKKEEEEKSKIEEMRLEEQRRMKEEEGRKKEEEEKRIMKEGKNKIEEHMRKKEEERKIKEIRLKEEEKRRLLKEEGRKREENNNRREEEEVQRKKEEDTKLIEVARKKIKEDRGRKNEQEIRLQEEGRKSDDKDKRRKEEVRMKQEEMSKKEEERKTEEETRKTEVEKMMVAQMKRKEDENKNIGEMQVKEDEEKGKKEEERRCSLECKDLRKEEEENTKDEEWRMWQEEEMRLKKEMEWTKVYEAKNKEIGQERKTKDEKQRQEEKDDVKKREDGRQNVEADRRQIEGELRKNKEENIKAEGQRLKEEEESNKIIALGAENEERLMRANEQHEMKRENDGMKTQKENTRNTWSPQLKEGTILTPSSPRPLHGESTTGPSDSETTQQNKLHKDIGQTSVYKTTDRSDAAVEPCASSGSLPVCLLENAEQRRLSWMRHCVPWYKLSFQNRRKQKGCVDGRRGLRRAAKVGGLPPLCLDTLLQSSGYKSLQEVTTVTLEDLPGCSLSPLSQCAHLRSLTLRRCGLKSLEGINQLSQLCYIDVQENDISFVDCENMIGLRVLRLCHNKLMSIHGLSGAENLDLLDLSHNSITRIAGLESMKKLQRLSVDHNQLISTKGLRHVYTLLHLDCSHNHLASVEGLENSALLQTLDLRANSLTEPPSLNNHILLRELHLDDNSISSLRGLVVCWLPLMHHLSVAQNRITLLPPMCDFVSLANLDLRFNCMSELQNVCGSLEGCRLLQEVHLTGNPLQQESGWRSALQKAVAGLRAVNGQETDPSLSAPAVQWVGSASGSFLTLCQAQLRQTRDLQRRHSMELGDASSHLDAVNSSCRHFTETLELAVDQRLAHEYGDTAVSAAQTIPKKTPDADGTNAEHLEIEPNEKAPPVVPIRNNISCSHWTLEETLSTENWRDALDTVTTALKIGSQSLAKKENSISSYSEMAPLYNGQDLDPKNTAAAMIQQRWRKYRQRCGSISSPPTAERGGGRGGEGGEPESGPFCFNRSVVGQDHAATIIQALWRGFALRRRLASALATVSCPDSAEDETFEEVDVDEFALDEAALEKHWTLLLSEESPSGHQSLSVEPPHLKLKQQSQPPWPFPEPSQFPLPPPPSWRPKQAWAAGEQVGSTGQRSSPESLRRSKSPGSASVLSRLSVGSKKILEEWGFTNSHTALLMLKRAQKMQSKKQQRKEQGDPSVHFSSLRICSYQWGPAEARNRPALHSRNYIKEREAGPDPQRAGRTEQVRQEREQQGLHTQSDRDSESEHFLPEINSDILNGGRVQLVADPGYTENLHHASGSWANDSLAASSSKEANYPRRNSLGQARKEPPSSKQSTSTPLKKERISFRDKPVQLSGGWGGGKKRNKVLK